jgi:hypothetical protein
MEYPEGSIEPAARPKDFGLNGPEGTEFEHSREGEDGQWVPMSAITDEDDIGRRGMTGPTGPTGPAGKEGPRSFKTFNSIAPSYTLGSPTPRSKSMAKEVLSDSDVPMAINIALS